MLLFILLILLVLPAGCTQRTQAPAGFVNVQKVIPDVQCDIRYYGEDNFVGTQINGYKAPVAILTSEAAKALTEASEEFNTRGYGLKIFDAYRPRKAVNHFIRWSKDQNDIKMKSWYYPNINKKDLFRLGYLAEWSAHCRGSAVDLTLYNKKTGEELDMGSNFDFLDKISAHGSAMITPKQAENRLILKHVMEKHGFQCYSKEWWHYRLINEPYPDQYFDFDVK